MLLIIIFIDYYYYYYHHHHYYLFTSCKLLNDALGVASNDWMKRNYALQRI
jgi:hypothetical protein